MGATGVHLHFWTGNADEAELLVNTFHYSERWPGNVQIVGTFHRDGGLFGDRGDCVAACVFSIPPTRWSVPVLELTRLVRREDCKPSLSALIARTCDEIRRKRMADLLVSFADAQQGHHGGVYQAASWQYAGQRDKSMDGVLINGTFMPGRSCNSKYGTRSPDKLRAILNGATVEPHYDEGKHLYWRPLTKTGRRAAAELELKSLPYPKPGAAAKVAA